jgi:hypothetical protein
VIKGCASQVLLRIPKKFTATDKNCTGGTCRVGN